MEQDEIEQPSTQPESRDSGDSFARLIVGFVVLPLILLVTYFITQIPYRVTSYRQFDDYNNGRRVGFISEYRGKVGAFLQVEFEGQPILLRATPDLNGPTLEVGHAYRVVGELGRSSGHIEGIEKTIDFVINNADLHPVPTR